MQVNARKASNGYVPEQLNWVDFGGVAGLIDTVAGTAPQRLSLLLNVLSSSSERLETRVVVELALQCRDPLAPLQTLCRDALKTSAVLDALLRAPTWRRVEDVCPSARAHALLNLCDATLENGSPHHFRRRQQVRTIRPRVRLAAVEERNRLGEKIEQQIRQRQAALPSLWELLESFIASDRRSVGAMPIPVAS